MPRLTRIYPYPAQGRADRPTDQDPVADVAIRGCRSVAELYSDAVAALDLPFRHTELRLSTHHDPALAALHGTVQLDPLGGGFARGHIAVPTAFVERSAAVRARMLLDAVHGIVLRLARDRGWDLAAVETCHRHVLDHDLTYRWTSPPKTSPDRRLLAYADFHLAEDGYGRARIRLVRRSDGEVVAISDEGLAFCTREGFVRAARSLRWQGSGSVSLVPYDWVPAVRGGALTLVSEEEQWHSVVDDYCAVRPVPDGDPALDALPVEVEGRGAAAPEQPPEISFVGGGPMRGAQVLAFDEVFSAEMRRLTGPAGQAWWSEAEPRLCDISILYECEQTRVRGRRTGNVLRIHVDQPAQDLVDVDTAQAAREVARQVVALVRRRTGLGPHPELLDA